jgi:hypothetical protein
MPWFLFQLHLVNESNMELISIALNLSISILNMKRGYGGANCTLGPAFAGQGA